MTASKINLEKLNAQQRAAVQHGVTGHGANIGPPLLVIAGAGSGKTSVLAHRVANLIVNGADPSRIMLLTFTRRAAAELDSRATTIIASARGQSRRSSAVKLPWSGTFHAVGTRLLRANARRLGLNPGFTIHDRDDSAGLMDMVRCKLGFTTLPEKFPSKDTCLAIYSRKVNAMVSLSKTLKDQFPQHAAHRIRLKRLFAGYVAAKREQHVLDFDDLLLRWAELLADPRVAADIGGRFDHILVDEYQDTNVLQAAILKRLKPTGAGLTVVGDDAQAIYSFRAAEVRNILDFPGLFKPAATIVKLEQNYRSTKRILRASNAVMAYATEGFAKKLRSKRKPGDRPQLVTVPDDFAQAAFVAERILENSENGRSFEQQAVLFRAGHHSAMLELELARQNIPFVKHGGLKFLEAAHVKDLLAVLRWAENPGDAIAGFRVVKLLPGIGPVIAARVIDDLDKHRVVKSLTAFTPPRKAASDWRGLVKLLKQLGRGEGSWPACVDLVRSWYQPYLEHHYDDAATRAADLDQLVAIAATFKSRRAFLTDLVLDPQSATTALKPAKKGDDDVLTLSTIHSAKGREWRSVFVLNVVDGCIPSSRAEKPSEIEEERRLLYVAMTRAKDELVLMTPWQASGRHGASFGATAVRSQFIPTSAFASSTPVSHVRSMSRALPRARSGQEYWDTVSPI